MGLPVYNLSSWDVVVGESAAQGHPQLPRVFQIHPLSKPLKFQTTTTTNQQPTKQSKKQLPPLLWIFLLLSWLYFQMCICDHPSKLVSSTVLVFLWKWDSKFCCIRYSRNTVPHNGSYLYICQLISKPALWDLNQWLVWVI